MLDVAGASHHLYLDPSQFFDELGINQRRKKKALPGRFNCNQSRNRNHNSDHNRQATFCHLAMDCANGFKQRRFL